MQAAVTDQTSKKNWFSIRTAAEFIGISERQLERDMEEDELPVIEIRGKLFILRRDLIPWIERRRARLAQPIKHHRKAKVL